MKIVFRIPGPSSNVPGRVISSILGPVGGFIAASNSINFLTSSASSSSIAQQVWPSTAGWKSAFGLEVFLTLPLALEAAR